jgi:ubiquinone/menaquinone biosynthesis C-methylase UbiE
MQALRSDDEIRDVNTRYHDVAAASYDSKWSIDFGQTGQSQVLGKFRKLLDADGVTTFPRALEIGCGTGYFSLNLMQVGLIDHLTCTDISYGMVDALNANAERLGLSERVRATRAEAELLPFPDASFDLVVGHAVLHHLPDLDRAFSEFRRVLRPGGRVVFAGEPSRIGDRLARIPKQAALLAAPAWRRLMGAAPAPRPDADAGSHQQHDHELESKVDIHSFAPADLIALATSSGFTDVTVRGEELVANWFGWFNRTLEMSANHDDVPMLWRKYAFHGYLLLQKLDQRALESRLPAALFYNLLLTARKDQPR